MGMDIFGIMPRSEKGIELHGNHEWWREIADYCHRVAPELCKSCRHWYTNDGDGLNEVSAVALAKILRASINDHTIEDYARALVAVDERTTKRGEIAEMEPFVESEAAADFAFLKKIAKFADFLEDCGGFEIW